MNDQVNSFVVYHFLILHCCCSSVEITCSTGFFYILNSHVHRNITSTLAMNNSNDFDCTIWLNEEPGELLEFDKSQFESPIRDHDKPYHHANLN